VSPKPPPRPRQGDAQPLRGPQRAASSNEGRPGPAGPPRRPSEDQPASAGNRGPGKARSRPGSGRAELGAETPFRDAAPPKLTLDDLAPRSDDARRSGRVGPRSSGSRSGPPTSSVRFKDPVPVPAGTTTAAAAGTASPSTPVRPTVPTGHELSPTGRLRAIRRPRPDPSELLPPAPSPRTAFRQRFGVVYDTQGPFRRRSVLSFSPSGRPRGPWRWRWPAP